MHRLPRQGDYYRVRLKSGQSVLVEACSPEGAQVAAACELGKSVLKEKTTITRVASPASTRKRAARKGARIAAACAMGEELPPHSEVIRLHEEVGQEPIVIGE